MKYYSVGQLAKMFKIKIGTVWARSKSRYAKERWGFETHALPNGTTRLYVPENELHKWEVKMGKYVGKPKKTRESK